MKSLREKCDGRSPQGSHANLRHSVAALQNSELMFTYFDRITHALTHSETVRKWGRNCLIPIPFHWIPPILQCGSTVILRSFVMYSDQSADVGCPRVKA